MYLATLPFLTFGEYIEEKHYVLSFAANVCSARAILLHTCHSWSRHILETWCMGEWGCVIIDESTSSLNGIDV